MNRTSRISSLTVLLLLLTHIFRTGVALAQIPPTIAEQPRSVIVPTGETVSFFVRPAGTEPFSYRWRSNGTTVHTNLTGRYWVSNAQHVARYDAVVSNPYGQRLSSRVFVSFFDYERTEDGLDLVITGPSAPSYGTNYVFELQHKPDYTATNWTVVTNLVLPRDTVRFPAWYFTNGQQGFFRAVLQGP